MPSPIDPAALAELLRALFTGPELRQFVAGLPNGDRLCSAMPGDPIALDALTIETAQLLKRHGWIDGALFAALADARPGRRHDIERICAAMGLAADQHTPEGQSVHQPHDANTNDDANTERLSKQLKHAYQRKSALAQAGMDTEAVQQEILQLKRELREGGQLKAGDQLGHGRYLLLETIGRGGFAVVWKALEQKTRELVAIKVLHSNLAGDIIRRERFFRGARMMATIAHEAVVRVLETHGEDGGFHYFVMEYVPGGNLHDAVMEERIRPRSAYSLLCTLSKVVADVHARGLIHRDIKPSNILLTPEHALKLTDFDLVLANDTTGGTHSGAMGTLAYAAPEMLDRPQDADAGADVYGLGMTGLFVAHGGPLPYVHVFGDKAKFIDNLIIGAEFANLLKRATLVDRDRRFVDGQALHTALIELSRGSANARRSRASSIDADAQMVDIPAGCFDMGSHNNDDMARDDERPHHRVHLSQFTCMRYPVTRRLWRQVMGVGRNRPNDDRPVTNISWFEAAEFCNRLSRRHGLEPCYEIIGRRVYWISNQGYRLLTEAEWEYACRGGTQTRWWFGDDESQAKDYVWHDANSNELQRVGERPANPWGLYDMHGNAWDWCWDLYGRYGSEDANDPHGPSKGTTRVVRGGSFRLKAQDLRSAVRDWCFPSDGFSGVGFRVARS